MIIRPARPDEIDTIIVMARDTFVPTLPFEKSEATATATIQMLMFSGGYVRVAEKGGAIIGFLVGMEAVARPWSTEPCAVELLLVVAPEHRTGRATLMLMNDFEAWAKGRGMAAVTFTAHHGLQGERVGQLYERRGYKPVETIYIKRLD